MARGGGGASRRRGTLAAAAAAVTVVAVVLAGCTGDGQAQTPTTTPTVAVAGSAQGLQQQFVQVVKQVGPSVVLIQTQTDPTGHPRPASGLGQLPG
jgi:hypothetical protein